ncbi:MAG TPA: helix-turn-helix transcriptional regulator, partial [Syntrophomonas sp.]|nr:helix-turn-helix transcriptional regulator [Syntrophomonas sp.]
VYDRLFELMKKRDITIYRLRKDGVVGTATLDKMRKGEGHVDTRSIESLCAYLCCQPGDLMEYVPD